MLDCVIIGVLSLVIGMLWGYIRGHEAGWKEGLEEAEARFRQYEARLTQLWKEAGASQAEEEAARKHRLYPNYPFGLLLDEKEAFEFAGEVDG